MSLNNFKIYNTSVLIWDSSFDDNPIPIAYKTIPVSSANNRSIRSVLQEVLDYHQALSGMMIERLYLLCHGIWFCHIYKQVKPIEVDILDFFSDKSEILLGSKRGGHGISFGYESLEKENIELIKLLEGKVKEIVLLSCRVQGDDSDTAEEINKPVPHKMDQHIRDYYKLPSSVAISRIDDTKLLAHCKKQFDVYDNIIRLDNYYMENEFVQQLEILTGAKVIASNKLQYYDGGKSFDANQNIHSVAGSFLNWNGAVFANTHDKLGRPVKTQLSVDDLKDYDFSSYRSFH